MINFAYTVPNHSGVGAIDNSVMVVNRTSCFFRGPNGAIFALWSISSHVRVQICRELVQLRVFYL
eukprot:UN24946